MGVEYMLINKTKKEYVSLGKYLYDFNEFQYEAYNDNKRIGSLLMIWRGDDIQLLNDVAHDAPEGYKEIDNWHDEPIKEQEQSPEQQ